MGNSKRESSIVGPNRLAEIAGRTREWARAKLREWLKEQEEGGPTRVFTRGKKNYLYTTIAVVQREFAGVHDPFVVRKLRDHDEAIQFLTDRVRALTTELYELRHKRTS